MLISCWPMNNCTWKQSLSYNQRFSYFYHQIVVRMSKFTAFLKIVAFLFYFSCSIFSFFVFFCCLFVDNSEYWTVVKLLKSSFFFEEKKTHLHCKRNIEMTVFFRLLYSSCDLTHWKWPIILLYKKKFFSYFFCFFFFV